MAIADVFDALVSKRCYKEAMPIGEAFDEIEKESGTHFDPKLVEVFLKHKGKYIIINSSLADKGEGEE
jgi:putative two-component system response regulator